MTLKSLGCTAFGVCLFFASVWSTALAQTPDISTWTATTTQNPDGRIQTQSDAVVGRYFMSALNAANGGGLGAIPTSQSQARLETAISVLSLDIMDITMTRLYGMPAATGTAYSENGEVAFAAALSGRAGSDRERLSLFHAPPATFSAMGGLEVLKQNRPKAVPKGDGQNAKTAKATPATPRAPAVRNTAQHQEAKAQKTKPPKTRAPRTQPTKRRTSGADLLAGVKRDIAVIEKKTAAENAQKRAAKQAADAKATVADQIARYKASGARRGFYPPLSQHEEFNAWPQTWSGFWQMQVDNDPRSPRIATRNYGKSSKAALRSFERESGLKIKGKRDFEAMDAYRSFDGRDVQILLTETDYNGELGVAFIFFARTKNSETSSLRVLEMPAKTYNAWGGVAGMLLMRGVIPSIDVFPQSERDRIAKGRLREQMTFYETVLNKFYMNNAIALMYTQAQTTAMMTELNYDLLFGNDITPGPWGY